MTVTDFITWVGGGGGSATAVVMLYLFITGRIVPASRVDEIKQEREGFKAERDEYKRALDAERSRSDAAVLTGQVVRDVMQGLRKEINQ